MGIVVQDPETERLVRQLAARRGLSVEATIREAIERLEDTLDDSPSTATVPGPGNAADVRDLGREETMPRETRLQAARDHVRQLAARLGATRTGAVADKAFYDSLYDDE